MSRFGEAMVCIIIGALCVLAGSYAATSQDVTVPTPTVTVTAPSWADGCSTDADCQAWEDQRTIEQPSLPDPCDVTMEGDEAGYFPCTDGPVDDVVGPDGNVHSACRVILTSDEDSMAVCADGTEWPS